MATKIVKNPKGTVVRSFQSDSVGRKYVDITYGRRGRLGKFLSVKKTKRVKLPRNSKISLIENNSPKPGFVRINFRKTK